MKGRTRRWIWLVALALGLVVAAWLGVTAYRGWRAASALLADLGDVEALASQPMEQLNPQEAVAILHRTRQDVEQVHAVARPFLWMCPYLGWLPHYGPEIEAAPDLLAIALNLTGAGDDLASALSPLIDRAAGETSSGGPSIVTEAIVHLAAVRPQLASTLPAVREALEARGRLDVTRLSPRVQGWVRRLDRYLPLMEKGVEASLLLPELLGADGPRTYLVLVQNEDELRATGGFISAVAQVTVDGGELIALHVEDSYAVDDFSQPYPEPPAPLREYMLADLWVFRDGNWSPDFPTSARDAIDLYTISRDVQVDGVIALDQHTIRLLVETLGPLRVDGFDDPVEGGNVIQLARAAWAPGDEGANREWWEHRKDFMADVLDAALTRAEAGLGREDMVRLARAGWRALREKHLLIYLADSDAASMLAQAGWDGAIRREPGDYLMVVESNVGFNKVNGVVEQDLSYDVDLRDPDKPRATLTVRNRHPATGAGDCRHESRYDATYEQMMQRCYWNYLRVYVPQGTRLVDATPHHVDGSDLLSGQSSPAEVSVGPPEAGRDVLATFLLVRAGEQTETRFELQPPQDVVRAIGDSQYEYRLTVQKQPGTRGVSLRVSLLLPPGVRLVSGEPEPSSRDGAEVTYVLTLETDQVLRVVMQ